MDFNTGSGSGRPGNESRPLSGGEAGEQPPGGLREDGEYLRGEFNLSDPMGSFTRTVVAIITHRLPSSAA
jgi:hypothetical protein